MSKRWVLCEIADGDECLEHPGCDLEYDCYLCVHPEAPDEEGARSIIGKRPEWCRQRYEGPQEQYLVEKDGNSWIAKGQGFVDLQESPSGHGDSPAEALADLLGADAQIKRLLKEWGKMFGVNDPGERKS